MNTGTEEKSPSATDGYARLRAELRWLDIRIESELRRFRAEHSMPMNEFRGLYVGDDQVEAALRNNENRIPNEELENETAKDLATQRSSGTTYLPLQRMCTKFGLDEFERNVLLIAAAPELDLRYELLYSYLNNDVTRKRPNCDLAFRLFCDNSEARWRRWICFTPDAPLFRYGLLEWSPEDANAPASSLARSYKVPRRVVDYLLNVSSSDPKLAGWTRNITPRKTWDDLILPTEMLIGLRRSRQLLDETPARILVLEGCSGVGKQNCAAALCGELGLQLLVVDVEALMTASIEPAELSALLAREQRLCDAGIYFHRVDAFFDSERHLQARARSLSRSFSMFIAPVVLACDESVDLKALLGELPSYRFRFPVLPFSLRRQAWEREFQRAFKELNTTDLDGLASRFVLTSGEIRDAVQSARDDLRLRERTETLPSNGDLFAAARAQSQRDLRSSAQRIEPTYWWHDLVLPPPSITQLREIADAVRHRHIVYGRWGFEQRLSLGKGLKALFSGQSGTGKTMAAEVLARELGLDLYKIDLSTVVSKYIGETEKNLDRIFRAAESSNAIVFFDEADALFGKRSEVKDAHDRYANIEVAYLLQKTEEYEGFVILATNLILNIDDAFKRRINYTVEFPFPDRQYREQLWRSMFPAETPLGDDLDFAFLAGQFPLSGGNIKNAALAAAFLAAAENGAVQMRHLIQAVAREWQKLGKLPSAADFKQYYPWAIHGEGAKGQKNT